MGTYKASRNNSEEVIEEEKSEKEQKKESTAKALDVGLETGLDIYTAGAFSKAKNAVTNVPIAGKMLQKKWDKSIGKAAGMLSNTPVGDLAKKTDDVGITDTARGVKDIYNMANGKMSNNSSNASSGKSNIFNNLSKLKGKSNNKSSLFGSGSFKVNNLFSFKMKLIIIGCFVGFFLFICIFMTVFAEPDDVNMGLTNNTEMSSKGGKSVNSAEIMSSLQRLAEYFIENAGEYNQSSYLSVPFIDRQVRKDCTGFATAFMHMISGNVPESYTGEMIDINGSWANSIKEAGWIGYTVDEIGSVNDLKPGDILVEHNSGTSGHAEIYVDATHTFGWGSQQTHYPLDKTIVDTSSGNKKSFGDGYHKNYTVVYRYQGGNTDNSTSNINFSDLNIIKAYNDSFNHGVKNKSNQKYIMLHDTEMNANAKDTVSSWKNSNCGGTVAAHFVIDKDGSVYQAADLDIITHHAGFGGPGNFDEKFGVGNNNRSGTNDDLVGQTCSSNYDGYSSYGMNSYSVGIEMVHVSGESYPEAQLNSLDKVIAYIDNYFGFSSTIIDHKEWRPSNSDTDSNFSQYLSNYKSNRHH